MKQTLLKIIGFAATSAMVFAFTFEGRTNLGANYEATRALMETRVRLAQTSFGAVSEEGVTATISALDSYQKTLKAEYTLFGCDAETPCR